MKTKELKVLVIGGGTIFYRDNPFTPRGSNYYQQHRSGGSIPQAPGHPVGKIKGQTTSHWLDPVGRPEASEGLLLLTAESNLEAKQRRNGGEGRGEQERADNGGEGGYGRLLEKGGGINTEVP